MHSPRFAIAALTIGVALWAQLALAPAVTGTLDAWSLVSALVALGVLVASAVLAPRRRELALALALAGFPLALAVTAVCAGRHVVPRYDASLRIFGALTALAYFALVLRWRQTQRELVPVTCVAAEPRDAPPAPRLRGVAFGALALVAGSVAVLMPAWLGAREPGTVAERVGGEALSRGRASMVAAVGAALALLVVLQGGSSLLRGSAAPSRLTSRAAFYMLWATCAYMMRVYLGRER